MRSICLSVMGGLLFAGTVFSAGIGVFDDKAAFLAQTGATPATTIPSTPYTFLPLGSGYTSGDLSFTLNAPGSIRFTIDDWTTRLPGNELAVSGPEEFDVGVDLGSGPVFSFGFDFVEPEFDPNVLAPFIDSEFTVTLKSGGLTVTTFTFERPNDSAQFVGVWTEATDPFDEVEIRETTGGTGNEFFGQFYTGVTPIPEPATLTLFGLGLFAWMAIRQRR